MSFVDELKAELEKTGFGGVEPSLDGEYQRWGDKKSFWLWSLEEGGVVRAVWADHRDGVRHEWCSKGKLSADEREGFEEKLKELDAEKRAEWERVAGEAQAAWDAPILDPLAPSLYFQRKGLGENYGCRVHNRGAERSTTWVPLRDIDGKMWSLQWIDQGGGKGFMSGGRVAGCFHRIGQVLEEADTVYICEGVATGASIYEAVGGTVVCAMNAGNMTSVCCAVREKYNVEIVVCGDSDDVGRTKAQHAAAQCGGRVAIPRGEGTDWNDLHVAVDLVAVKTQLQAVLSRGKPLFPIDGGFTKEGKPKAPKEVAVVNNLLQYYGDWVCSQDGILFMYNGVHWEEATADHVASVKQKIRILYGDAWADIRKMDAAYKHFVVMTRKVPMDLMPNGQRRVDLFRANPAAANFENGSLWCVKHKDRSYELVFQPGHRPDDWLTTVLPYQYDPKKQAKNRVFDDMMERIFLGDEDAEEKKRAVAQMFGACLLPAFPRLFFLYGKSGTGKSTVINLATKLVSLKNTCGVEPHQFKGFLMEDMLNKLVNCVTDVTLDESIADSIIKQIVDKKPIYIQRKGVKNVMGYLPPIHIFGGNGIPGTKDGGSGAHERRWTFLGFDHVQYVKGESDQDYWDTVYEAGPEGILNFALRGLEDLCATRGHWTQPVSGEKRLKEWEDEDQVGEFLRNIRDEEGLELVGENCLLSEGKEGDLVRKKDFYRYYQCWREEAGGAVQQLGKYKFFDKVEQRGLEMKRNKKDLWCYIGFKMTPGPRAKV